MAARASQMIARRLRQSLIAGNQSSRLISVVHPSSTLFSLRPRDQGLFSDTRRCYSSGADSKNKLNKFVPKFHKLLKETDSRFQQGLLNDRLVQQQLLREWLSVIPHLHSKYLRTSTEYADGLARKLLSGGVVKEEDVAEILRGWARLERPLKAESLIKRLIESSQPNNSAYRPEEGTSLAMIQAWSKENDKDSLSRALFWFQQIEHPPVYAYNCLLNAYSNHGNCDEATKLLQDMRDHPDIELDVISFATVMKAWTHSKRDDAQENVERLLEELKRSYSEKGEPLQLRPNAIVYGTAMTLAAPERAESLLQEMQELYQRTRDPQVVVQARHYMSVMRQWAKSGQPQQAKRLLMEMQAAYEAGNDSLKPNNQCFVAVINAFAKQSTSEGALQAENILNVLEQLCLKGQSGIAINNYGYNSVMDAFSRSDASKVESIFDRMKDLAENHNIPSVAPDAISYTILMKAWVNEGVPDYASKVERLLEDMEYLGKVKPDLYTYSEALRALAKCGDADSCTRGEAIIGRMTKHGVKPNRVCFNSIITMYANQRMPGKAKGMLNWMEQEATNGNSAAKPNARDYSACITAYAKSHIEDEQKFNDAFQLFSTVVDRNRSGDRSFTTNHSIVTSIAKALANAPIEGKAEIAKRIIEMGNEIDNNFGLLSYNALLHACATESGSPEQKREALELSVQTYQVRHQRGIAMNSSTFINLLCCCNLIADEDEKIAATDEFFQRCCEAGKVNEDVLSHFRQFNPSSPLLSDLKQDTGSVDGDRIPDQWKRAI